MSRFYDGHEISNVLSVDGVYFPDTDESPKLEETTTTDSDRYLDSYEFYEEYIADKMTIEWHWNILNQDHYNIVKSLKDKVKANKSRYMTVTTDTPDGVKTFKCYFMSKFNYGKWFIDSTTGERVFTDITVSFVER